MTPTVTGLGERKRGRVAIELDGRPWRVLPAEAVVRAGLSVGRGLDRHTARELAREVRRARALAQATRTLATSGRSRGELEQRLARAGHSGVAREEALATLDRAGLVDDARLAERRAELLARRGYGDAAIRADLRRRLIGAEAAADAVTALEPEDIRVRRLLAGKQVTPPLLRRLASRGFSRDTLNEVASAFAQEA
ncbi:MAG TPA: RecX family transcriptional regulator [Gaiellaceae bacterium]|nr:RecX family transcriptional regulator [Gaiellaceae bacterium]